MSALESVPIAHNGRLDDMFNLKIRTLWLGRHSFLLLRSTDNLYKEVRLSRHDFA